MPREARGLAGPAKGIITMAIVVCLAISVAEAQEIYKWVDEKGVTHYSDVAPPDKQSKDIDTVKGDKGASSVGTPTIPSAKTESSATSQPTTQQPAQIDAWVDEYGNRHSITEELIAQEEARLKERLHYYEYDCKDDYKGIGSDSSAFKDRSAFAMQAKDRHRKGCEDSAEAVKQKLRELASSPKLYFYSKYEREKQKAQRGVATQTKDSVFNPKTGEYYPRSGEGYINPHTGEYYPAAGNGAVNPRTGEHYE